MKVSFSLLEDYKRMPEQSFVEVTQRTSANVA